MIDINHPFFLNQPLCNSLCDRNYKPVEGSNFKLPYDVRLPLGKYKLSSCRDFESLSIKIYTQINEVLKNFPDCCEDHAKMKNEAWFRKEYFDELPGQMADKVMYSYIHILNHINNENWYDNISNYLEYIKESFGSLPCGFGEPVFLSKYYSYMDSLRSSLESRGLNMEKISIIYDYLKEQEDHGRNPKKAIDPSIFAILDETYTKWLNLFPFHPYFTEDLKQHLESKPPLIKEVISYNPYTDTYKVKVFTQNDLVLTLVEWTRNLIKSVKSAELVRQDLIPDIEKHRLNLLLAEHETETNKLLNDFISEEELYLDVIEKWLQIEIKSFDKIALFKEHKVEDKIKVVETPPLGFMLKGTKALIKDKAINLHNSLVTHTKVPPECKKDFVKLFTGQVPENKIPWLGQKGELRLFIDLLLSLDKIDDCRGTKWIITASNFKFSNEDFTADSIKDVKKPKNGNKIERIVQNII